MADRVDKEVRSKIMASVGTKDTNAEMAVRRLIHGMGYRYVLHRADLPGKPDIVFPSRRSVVFVHGCFWHGHSCRLGRRPKSNRDYWLTKIDSNRCRDRKQVLLLRRQGWKVLVVWQCQIRKKVWLEKKIMKFLNADE